jgi:hypothetical protein
MTGPGLSRLLLVLAVVSASTAVGQSVAGQPGVRLPLTDEPVASPADCRAISERDASLDLVSKLCAFALTYRQQLPDFIVQQTTTSEGMSKTVITAQVTFQDGAEHYSNVKIDGRAAPVSSITASLPSGLPFSSTGEFGPALLDLFKIPGATEFKFRKNSTLSNQPVAIYDFHVPEKKNLFWTFRIADGRTFRPAFDGVLWLQAQTGRPLREEMEPLNLPASADITSAKTVVDYAMTAVGDAGTFLLPVKSESTICNQGVYGMGACTTNTLVFHGYRKFGATTRIVNNGPAP